MSELEQLRDAAMQAALAGGEIVRAHFGKARDIEEKAPGDWVSAADLGSEAAVRATLERLTPHVDFFGEETGGNRDSTLAWYVDPLDGTANFLHGFESVGVSIGLVRDGEPVVGVVHAPFYDRTFHGYQGGGAWCDDKQLHVSDRVPGSAIPSTGFPFRLKHRKPAYLLAFQDAFATFEDLRRAGAASLDLSWTAAGVFDGHFELGLGTWDVAAGSCLVREAGGVVTDWHGDSNGFLWSGDIVAGPPLVHAELLRIAQTHIDV